MRYPWGNAEGKDRRAYANYTGTGGKDRWEFTAPVGSFDANGYGLYDMAGNVSGGLIGMETIRVQRKKRLRIQPVRPAANPG